MNADAAQAIGFTVKYVEETLKGAGALKGEKGDQGIQGEQGPAGEVGPIGPAGPAGPQGEKGDKGEDGAQGTAGLDGKDGTTYTPSIGEVTTVDSNELASATVSVNTETKEAVFNFAIPKGNKGLDGKDGVQINDSSTNSTSTWSSKKTSDEIAKVDTELNAKVDKTSIVTELSDASTDDEVVGALTAYNELQKLESANKEQFATASGDSITVNDSVDGKLVELGVKGNSFQQSYSGKNLLNATLETTTLNGITCTNNGDGTYTIDTGGSPATGNTIFTLSTFIFNANTKYKLIGCPSGGSNSTYRLDTAGINSDIGNGSDVQFTQDATYDIRIDIASGTVCDNLIFKPMLTTNLSATYDDFVPYTGDGDTLTHDVAEIKNDLGGLTFSASGTTLSITDGTNTWTLGANS